jgi:hypothetical protein
MRNEPSRSESPGSTDCVPTRRIALSGGTNPRRSARHRHGLSGQYGETRRGVNKVACAVRPEILNRREPHAFRAVSLLRNLHRSRRYVEAQDRFGAQSFEKHRCGRTNPAAIVHHEASAESHPAQTFPEPVHTPLREVLSIFPRGSQRFGKRAIVGVGKLIEVCGRRLQRRAIPSWLMKKLRNAPQAQTSKDNSIQFFKRAGQDWLSSGQ